MKVNLHFKIQEIQNASKLQIRCEYELTLNCCFGWTVSVERPLEQNCGPCCVWQWVAAYFLNRVLMLLQAPGVHLRKHQEFSLE